MDAQDIAQLQRVTDPVGQVVLLELSSPAFSDTLRIANDTHDHTLAGEHYYALPFYFKLPDRRQDGSPRAQLAIDNVGRGMTDELESYVPGVEVTAHIIVCSKTDPLRVIQDMYLPLTNVSCSNAVATADCGIAWVTSQKSVRRRFNPFHAPGIF